ncbi:glucosaminidase domain-containing protein [uncultured Ilyobacter sp.]|jgi:Bax protein|uniref:glucosaminidase domain-containing protein n=1 Tax=uncultured Ilyobacter sp. TaxID=544433 RepID=UPI0029BFF800|nr:glucosaminidase domain-containing protein [uncultured Ilyobacter sp.]
MKELKWSLFFLYLFLQIVTVTSGNYMRNTSYEKPDVAEIITKEKTSSNYKIIYVDSPEDLKKEEKSKKYVYAVGKIDLSAYPVEEKKDLFVKLMMPAIEISRDQILENRSWVKKIIKRGSVKAKEKDRLEKLYDDYGIEDGDNKKLLEKMIIPPTSLILSQAALESGWGTSRFFREGNNVFGIWSYDSSDERIKAGESRENGFTAYLKKFVDLKEAVDGYILLISTGSAYENLRKGINRGENSEKLAKYLVKYSELGYSYTERIEKVIRVNELEKYDI